MEFFSYIFKPILRVIVASLLIAMIANSGVLIFKYRSDPLMIMIFPYFFPTFIYSVLISLGLYSWNPTKFPFKWSKTIGLFLLLASFSCILILLNHAFNHKTS